MLLMARGIAATLAKVQIYQVHLVDLSVKRTPFHFVHARLLLYEFHILPVEVLEISTAPAAAATLLVLVLLIWTLWYIFGTTLILLMIVVIVVIAKNVLSILLLYMLIHQVVVVNVCAFVDACSCKFLVAKSLFFWIDVFFTVLNIGT